VASALEEGGCAVDFTTGEEKPRRIFRRMSRFRELRRGQREIRAGLEDCAQTLAGRAIAGIERQLISEHGVTRFLGERDRARELPHLGQQGRGLACEPCGSATLGGIRVTSRASQGVDFEGELSR
jgi:hypothetical protein